MTPLPESTSPEADEQTRDPAAVNGEHESDGVTQAFADSAYAAGAGV